jgi:lipoyl(octanoyl) transferase
MHGFALNVTTDLGHFQRIIPCGIFERGVTSLREVLGTDIPLSAVARHVVLAFGEVFSCAMEPALLQDLLPGAAGLLSGGAGIRMGQDVVQ